VGLRLGSHLPDDARECEAEPRHHAQQRGPRQHPDQIDGDRGGHRNAQPSEQVHPEGGIAEWRQQDVGHPAQQDVGREAGRVEDREGVRHRLCLGGVPETP